MEFIQLRINVLGNLKVLHYLHSISNNKKTACARGTLFGNCPEL